MFLKNNIFNDIKELSAFGLDSLIVGSKFICYVKFYLHPDEVGSPNWTITWLFTFQTWHSLTVLRAKYRQNESTIQDKYLTLLKQQS